MTKKGIPSIDVGGLLFDIEDGLYDQFVKES